MKRQRPLVPYSHEHHHALSQARRLLRGSAGNAVARIAASRSFLDFYDTRVVSHLSREEEQLFPRALASQDSDLKRHVESALADHQEIRMLVARLRAAVIGGRTPTVGEMRALGELLTDHVRFEERVVFEGMQRVGAVGPVALTS